MKKITLCICLSLLLSVAAGAQAPNFDYGIQISNSSGYIVNGNVYDIPTFGDWDDDGDQDLMVGVFFNGNIYYYQNTAGAGNTPVFSNYTVLQADGVNISVTYGWCTTAAPRIVDWNGDNLKDLLVGENNGNIRYFQNVGTVGNPSLHYIGLLQAGGTTLDVGSYSTVWTDDWNGDGLVDVLAGESDGVINLYLNTGSVTNPVLAAGALLTTATGQTIDVGSRSCPNVADYNGDGLKDLISGDINGKVFYYQNNGTNSYPLLAAGVTLHTGNLELKTMSTSRVATIDWDNNGANDIVIGSWDPRLRRFMRTASSVMAPSCDLTTIGSTTIPAIGGNFNYNFTANNATSSTVNFDAWTDVSTPSYGPFSNPLFQRTNLTISPNSSLTRAITQYVPGSAPSGSYYHYGYLGDLDQKQVYSWDYVYFTKSAGDCDGSALHDWTCSGWDCDPVVNASVNLPTELSLSASPNPFNPTTTITFDLIEDGAVKVGVYNIAGQLVAQLINRDYPAGNHQVVWEASGMPAGVYIVTLDAGRYHAAQKVTLLK